MGASTLNGGFWLRLSGAMIAAFLPVQCLIWLQELRKELGIVKFDMKDVFGENAGFSGVLRKLSDADADPGRTNGSELGNRGAGQGQHRPTVPNSCKR